VHDSSPSDVEIATVKLKRYKSPGIDQILAELIQTEDEIHKLINSNSNTEDLRD
jgi:hypothetical protein